MHAVALLTSVRPLKFVSPKLHFKSFSLHRGVGKTVFALRGLSFRYPLLAISLPRSPKNATRPHEIDNRDSRADSPCQGCGGSSTGTRIHSERTATYVAVLERVAPYCSRIDRGATSNAPRRRRGEERDEEGTRARVSRRRKGCAEGGGATMEGSGDACACFAASLSNYRAFCPLRSQVAEEKIYLPACLSVSLCLFAYFTWLTCLAITCWIFHTFL